MVFGLIHRVQYNVSNFSICRSTKIYHDIWDRQYFTLFLQPAGTSLMRWSRMILSLHISSAQYRNRTVHSILRSISPKSLSPCNLFLMVYLPVISLYFSLSSSVYLHGIFIFLSLSITSSLSLTLLIPKYETVYSLIFLFPLEDF